MTAKAILDIDFNSEGFERFKAMFDKYTESVSKLPGDWAKVGQSTRLTTEDFGALVLAAQRTAAATERMAEGQEKFHKLTASTSYAMEGLARNTRNVAGYIMDATTSLLKWTGILGAVGGLLGAGGIWGIDRLALSAGGARRSALGVGTSTGNQSAFSVNYNRLVDPGSFLENIANAQSDLSVGGPLFAALGISDYKNRDPADLGAEVLEKSKEVFRRQGSTQQGADAFKLTSVLSMDELRRLDRTPESEMAGLRTRYGTDKSTLAIDPGTTQAWQDFNDTMRRAGATIENVFVVGLRPLEKPMEDLSKAFSEVVVAFLKAPEIKQWLIEAGDGLEHFAKFIGTPAFRADVEDFVAGIGRLGHVIVTVVDWIASKISAPGGKSAPSDFQSWLNADPKNDSYNNQGVWGRVMQNDRGVGPKETMAHDYFIGQGYPEAAVAGILGNLKAESGFDTTAWNKAGGGQGAQGWAQWRGDRIDAFRAAWGHDPRYAPADEQLDFLAYELRTSKKGVGDALMKATDPRQASDLFREQFEAAGPSATDTAARERYAADFQAAFGKPVALPAGVSNPSSGTQYGGTPGTPPLHADPAAGKPSVRLDINNNTGGSAVISTSQASGA